MVTTPNLNKDKVYSNLLNPIVSLARPTALWLSVITLGYSGIGVSLINAVLTSYGLGMIPEVSEVAQQNAMIILLGISVIRSFDKKAAVTEVGVINKQVTKDD